MCSDDFDPPEFYSQSQPSARKQHRCYECHRAIPVGEVHRLIAGKWEGVFSSMRIHEACWELRGFIEDVVCGGHGSISLGGLDEEISEAGQYIDCDHDAWEEAGLEPPNPLEEVFNFIKASYPAYQPAVPK